MIKFLLVVIGLFTGLTVYSQKDSVRKYLDADLHFTTKKEMVYPAMAIRMEDHWVLYAVYPDTAILLTAYFKDAALTIKDGPFILYHARKIKAQSGYFKDNTPNGVWQSWYTNGQLKNEGLIVNNHFSGVWKAWYQNGHMLSERTYYYTDSLSGTPVHQHSPDYRVEKVLDDFTPEGKLEGSCTTWYENGNRESTVNYHNDSLTGSCTWYRSNGHPSSRELYVNGKVEELECYDEEGRLTGSTCSILKLPLFIHPFLSAEDYIIDELHKEKNRDIKQEGDAMVNFTVNSNGKIENLTVASSPDPALSKHIIKIISGMPAWSPAITHNRKIDYPVQLIIPYYRN
jgi:antitoxin component YwqK of YwqJK toxin-antitoxin module